MRRCCRSVVMLLLVGVVALLLATVAEAKSEQVTLQVQGMV
ncbi:MAG: hypothetical protein ACE5JD_17425 [Candidatus Methylomirabilia bacterium]